MSDKTEKIMLAQNETLNTGTMWILFLFLGWSYGSMGKVGTQILYYLTLGGFGIWALIRLFTLNSSIQEYNNKVYMRYGLNDLIR